MRKYFLLLFTVFLIYGAFHAQTEKENKANLSKIKRLWAIGELDECLIFSKKILLIPENVKNDSLKGLIFNEMGIAYDYKGEYAKSLASYFKAEKLLLKTKDAKTIAYIYSNIGLVYGVTKKYEKALNYYQKSLKIQKEINDSKGISAVYNNMAIVFMDQKKFEKAIFYYKKSLKIDIENKELIGTMDSYNNLGVCYMKIKQYSKAETYFKKSLEIAKHFNISISIQNSTNNLSTIYLKQDRLIESRKLINEVLKLSLKNGSKANTSKCYGILKLISLKEKDYENAYKYLLKELELETELLGKSNFEQIAKLEVKLEYEKKQEIEKEKLARSEAEGKVNSILLITTFLILILVLFTSVFLFRKWKATQEQKKEIAEKNNLLNEKNNEIFQSINYAQRIQHALLPSSDKISSIFPKNSLLYLPKDIISGDFYWTFETENFQYIAVADCTGHGVPGALMNMICHNALNRSILEFSAKLPGEILDKTREIVVAELSKKDENVNDGMDISLLAIDKKNQKIYWSGAHNDLWILKEKTNELFEVKAVKQPIGKHFQYDKFENNEINCEIGDRLFLLTDGFGDQFGGEKNKKFKNSNFKNLLIEKHKLSLEELCKELKTIFENWKGSNEQIDDVCLLVVEI